MAYVPGKPRSAKNLRRQSLGIKEFSRVLIACEGEKTEPYYLRELCKSLGLTAAMVEIAGKECESSPKSVFEYADARWKEDGSFDEIFCVFDRDKHETFDATVKAIKEHRSRRMKSIFSYPCFEYWILLHFTYSRGAVAVAGKRSAGDQMLSLVLAKWPGYEKGGKSNYAYLSAKNLTDTAITHAVRAKKDAEDTGNPDPSTKMDELVVRLRALGEELAAIQSSHP